MADIVQEMMQIALGDGARSTKFEAYINFSASIMKPHDTDVYLNVKTSSFPGKTADIIDLKYKGRSIPIKGQVKYDNTWTCTFYLTEGHELKLAFEDWIESLDQTQNMSSDLNENVIAGKNAKYTTEVMLAQFDFHGEDQTSVYTIHNAFPKSVSAVEVDYSSVGTLLEYTVEFSYSHYTAVRVGGFKGSAKNNLDNGSTKGWGNIGKALKGTANKLIGSINDQYAQTADMLETQGKDALKRKIKELDPFNAAKATTNIASNFAGASEKGVTNLFGAARSKYTDGFNNATGERQVESINKKYSVLPSGENNSSNKV